MTEQYNNSVATHYAAYRPPLHQIILKKLVASTDRFTVGLDVGCGTGCSSVALADFCQQVYAIDPSQSMLHATSQHESITYLQGAGEALPLPDRSIDIATLAGSLYYICAKTAARELRRVCRNGAPVLVYDFEVHLDPLLERLDLATTAAQSFDHLANFSACGPFQEMLVRQERIALDVRAVDLAHIVLADKGRHSKLVHRYQSTTPCEQLTAELGADGDTLSIEADLYYSAYRVPGDARQG